MQWAPGNEQEGRRGGQGGEEAATAVCCVAGRRAVSSGLRFMAPSQVVLKAAQLVKLINPAASQEKNGAPH